MCSPGSTSNLMLVKDEDDLDTMPVPTMHKDAVADAMEKQTQKETTPKTP